MKHDHSMLAASELAIRTESRFVRYLHSIFMYGAQFLRLARAPLDAISLKENTMANLPEIPNDDEILAALNASENGLTARQLVAALEADHTRDNIIRAIQRVLDRGKVCLSDGARLVATPVYERVAA